MTIGLRCESLLGVSVPINLAQLYGSALAWRLHQEGDDDRVAVALPPAQFTVMFNCEA